MKKPLLFILLIIFFACSKTDEPGKPDEPEIPQSSQTNYGYFIDSPVEGVRYETETHSGFTDSNGEYEYEDGETVTFYIGDIKLGSALASAELTPISIASTSNATIESPEVQNIASLLQTLDLDRNPTNGITIGQEVVEALSVSEIDFTKSIVQILGEIALEVFEKTGIELNVVFPENAAVHLAQTLEIEFEPEASFTYNFLPTFMNYSSLKNKAVNWIHEFSEDGRLIRSRKYEKFPSRIKEEYNFIYNSDPFHIKVEREFFDYTQYGNEYSESFNLVIDEEFNLKEKITGEMAQTGFEEVLAFTELNDNKWVTTLNSTYKRAAGEPEEIRREFEYVYDDIGFITESKVYDISGNLISKVIRTPTDFGEIKSEINEVGPGIVHYYYRNDNTLEKMFVQFEGTTTNFEHIYEYDETEAISVFTNKDLLNDKKSIHYYDERGKLFNEFYESEILREKTYFNLEAENNYKLKTEYFNENGDLEYTEYYDENGNITETVYE